MGAKNGRLELLKRLGSKCIDCIYFEYDYSEEPCIRCHERSPFYDESYYQTRPNVLQPVTEDISMEKTCSNCINSNISKVGIPCRYCDNTTHNEWQPAFKQETSTENFDEHYQSEHQPIEVMQSNMTPEEFVGFLKGNIIKYVCRLGKKDEPAKEAAKIRRYSEWLEKAIKGEKINPRD